MPPFGLTALITPLPGKSKRFLELFAECVEFVKEHEPYVLRYELHRAIQEKDGEEQFVVYEEYADQEALDKHMAGAPIQKIVKAVEEEKLTETKIIMTTRGPGITPRL